MQQPPKNYFIKYIAILGGVSLVGLMLAIAIQQSLPKIDEIKLETELEETKLETELEETERQCETGYTYNKKKDLCWKQGEVCVMEGDEGEEGVYNEEGICGYDSCKIGKDCVEVKDDKEAEEAEKAEEAEEVEEVEEVEEEIVEEEKED